MSLIVATNRGGMCSICIEEFGPQDRQVTHVGGENHDGFHEECLKKWLVQNPTCPCDRQPIQKPLLTRSEKLVTVLTGAVCGAFFGTVSSLVARTGVARIGVVAGSVLVGVEATRVAVISLGMGLPGPIGAVLGEGIDRFLNHRGVHFVDRQTLGAGMFACSLSGIAVEHFVSPFVSPPMVAVVGGVASGILSLVQHR